MMTKDDQRSDIAKWCGWSHIEDLSERMMMVKGLFLVGYPPTGALVGKKESLPDYLRDLNAIHVAEGKLNPEQWTRYMPILHEVVGRAVNLCIHATADQRSEAICRTLWPERWL